MSIDLAPTDFRFLRPLWLFGLLAIPALLWWLRRLRQRRDVWRDAVDAHLLSHLLSHPLLHPHPLSHSLVFWIVFLVHTILLLFVVLFRRHYYHFYH